MMLTLDRYAKKPTEINVLKNARYKITGWVGEGVVLHLYRKYR